MTSKTHVHRSPPFSVIIVLHNSAEDLESCLASIPTAAEVIVVDNASTDGGPRIVRQVRPSALVVELGANTGFGHACNEGVRHSHADFLVFLNPDTRVEPGALATLRQAWVVNPRDVVGPALTERDGTLRHNCRRASRLIYDLVELLPAASRWCPAALRRDFPRGHPVYATGGPIPYVQGACIGVGRESFLNAGGFDTDFFLYSEEEDLCRRVQMQGGRSRYVPGAVVSHIAQTSSSKVPLFSVYHLYRSKVVLYRKQMTPPKARRAIAMLRLALLGDRTVQRGRQRCGLGVNRERAWSDHALQGVGDGAIATLHEPSKPTPDNERRVA